MIPSVTQRWVMQVTETDDKFRTMNGITVWFTNGDFDEDRVAVELLGANTAGPGGSGRRRSQPTHEYVASGFISTLGLPIISTGDVAARVEAARQDFEAFLARHARTANIPVLGPATEEGLGTRWFGRPCMPASRRWPEDMNFVVQLDGADVPGGLPGGACGLLLFVKEGGCGDGEDAEVVLLYPAEACVLHEPLKGVTLNPPLVPVSWREVVEHPWLNEEKGLEGREGVVDLKELLTSVTYGEVTLVDGRNLPEAEAAMQDVAPLCHTWECDKIGGWPRWEQGRNVPLDRKGQPMRFVLQVGYEGLILGDFNRDGVDWPTWGRGQVFVSDTTGEARYVWACD